MWVFNQNLEKLRRHKVVPVMSHKFDLLDPSITLNNSMLNSWFFLPKISVGASLISGDISGKDNNA